MAEENSKPLKYPRDTSPKTVNETQRWWDRAEVKTESVYKPIKETTERLGEDQRYRQELNLRHMRLYGNQQYLQSLQPGLYAAGATSARSSNLATGRRERLTLNIVQSVIDTLVSKIAKAKPRVMFLTSGGDRVQKERAQRLSRFLDGVFYWAKAYKKAVEVFRDGCVFGTGFLKVFIKDDEIKMERVFPNEIMVNEAEGVYGEPRSLYQLKYHDRAKLMAAFPDKKGEIAAAEGPPSHGGGGRAITYSNQVLVVEAWHLPSGPGARDGRHAMVLESATLFDEEYTRDRFPFVEFRYGSSLLGYFGQGLSEILTPIQVEINRILAVIQRALEVVGVPWIFIERGAKVVKGHMQNVPGVIINYTGNKPPQVSSHQAINPEQYIQVDRLYNRGFEIAGVSSLSAQSKKPSGLDSGKALLTFNDIESERFAITGQGYEAFFVELGDHCIELATVIDKKMKAEGNAKGYVVTAAGKDEVEEIEWSKVSLKESRFVMQPYPVSSLPKTPAGRLQFVQEMAQGGIIDRETALQLLDFPDLDNTISLLTASREDLEGVIEELEKGNFVAPEPTQDLITGVQMVQQGLRRAARKGASEAVQEAFRNWLLDAQALLAEAQQPAPPQPQMPPTQASSPAANQALSPPAIS
jgi:hypothetical protein